MSSEMKYSAIARCIESKCLFADSNHTDPLYREMGLLFESVNVQSGIYCNKNRIVEIEKHPGYTGRPPYWNISYIGCEFID